MALIKVVKNKAYFKRFQVKFRRRREGKTDYYARKRLIWMDKNKYNSPRYRLVVRFSNKDICCQIVYAKIVGDCVLESAYSHELPRYGLNFGLTNYSAAYCTGLLLARRLLKKIGMDSIYSGTKDITGEIAPLEEDEERRPFTAVLDVGLRRTTTGCNLFGALKGAVDGGLDIPHSDKRFFGYSKNSEDNSGSHDADAHKHRIFGGHVADYMKMLEEEDEEDAGPKNTESKEVKPFSKMEKLGVTADDVKDLYAKVHSAIYADPSRQPSTKPEKKYETVKRWNRKKLTLLERRNTVQQKKEAYRQKLMREAEED